jgi:phage baseplate assembly protein W
MPIPQTIRINPLDLQKNIAIGVSLPFDGEMGPFNSTYSTQEQIKSNLINLLLTAKGERVFNPEFGSDLKKIVFEQLPLNTQQEAKNIISNIIIRDITAFIPQIDNVIVDINSDPDTNSISITVSYNLKLSGNSDQITVEFI